MNLLSKVSAISGAIILCAANGASAGVIFSEDFSGATPGTYGVGMLPGTQFNVSTDNVDVVGVLNGSNFTCTGNPAGNCVDLVGSNNGGGIQSIPTFALKAGDTYVVSFGGTLQSVNRRPSLTPDRRPTLTPLARC
jgi:hypothetical protein